jgi:hypothetical protein
MKKLLIALSLTLLVSLGACLGPDIVVPVSCEKYVELNYSNYDSLKTDPITVLSVDIGQECIYMTLQYGGGCEEHKVDLALILPECGTPPLPPPTFEIRHDAKGDVCKALITKDYSFDLTGIREEGKTSVDFVLMVRNNGEVSSTTYTYNY